MCFKTNESLTYMYSIEWQKRSLPHCHLLLFLSSDSKIRAENIDDIIFAKIPNEKKFPKLFSTVARHMVHGPCGTLNPNSPCMNNNKCTKNLPKTIQKKLILAIQDIHLTEEEKIKMSSTIDGLFHIIQQCP